MICENCGAQVDERVGVCPFCGVIQTQAKRWKQQFFVSPDHCCLCGKTLNGRYQVLFTYASGDEARVCGECATLIAAARNRRDPAAAQAALTRLNGMLSSESLDPAVADQLRQIAGETERWLNSLRAVPAVQTRTASEPARSRGNKIVLLTSLLVILIGIVLIVIGASGGFRSKDEASRAPTPTPANMQIVDLDDMPAVTPTPTRVPVTTPTPTPTPTPTTKPAGISTPIPKTTPEPTATPEIL
ncbi:MAG: hypothetical protein IK127_08130 [Clostridia bacterium]|nr:hypothetical protein [Clostridia bacterium]